MITRELVWQFAKDEADSAIDHDLMGNPITSANVLLMGAFGPLVMRIAEKAAAYGAEHVAQAPAASKVLTEHSGCGHGTQVDQLTVRLNPGDKVVLVMGPYSAAAAKSQSPD